MTVDGQVVAAAMEAVRDGCRATADLQSALGPEDRRLKGDDSPVTVADYVAQVVVMHRLCTALGEQPMMAEEDADLLRRPEAHTLRQRIMAAAAPFVPSLTEEGLLDILDRGKSENQDAYWVLDPIDGTRGFLHGAQFCVALARIEAGEPVVGLLGCPNLTVRSTPGVLFVATHDGPATLSSLSGDRGPFRLASRRKERVPISVRLTSSAAASHCDPALGPRILRAADLPQGPKIGLDSQVKYGLVAAGEADGYVRLPRNQSYVEKIWDHAAGTLIATRAGCQVTDFSGRPLRFDVGRHMIANRGLVVAPPALADRLLESIAGLGLAA
ncbi:MAG: inositol monophosphatase family protein [Myxococcota bacterium]